MAQKKLSKTRQEIHALYEANELADLKQRQTRARSFCVGTANGGVIELSMRGDFANLWYIMNPVEAIEIIGQLAAASGVEIAMRPRNDFASWRGWDTTLPPSVFWMGTNQTEQEDMKKIIEAKSESKKLKSLNNTESKDEPKPE